MTSGAPFRYRVFGLTLASEFELPELHSAEAVDPVDAVIVRAPLPPAEPQLVSGPAGASFEIPGVGRYRICEGSRIEVDPFCGVEERSMRLYLLGSALGALLHQRGLLALHANAVAKNGSAVAFLGHSGAGKSTLAAHLHDRGFELLTDDVSVIDPYSAPPLVSAGIPRLRLWRDAVERSGRSASDFDQAYADWDKFNVPARNPAAQDSVPLQRIYLLVADRSGSDEVSLRRLQGVEAVDALVANTYRGAWVQLVGDTARHLAACVALARAIPVIELRRPWGEERLSRVQEQIEALITDCPSA
jgi:hypothetical protein